jgi:hypothetical protein
LKILQAIGNGEVSRAIAGVRQLGKKSGFSSSVKVQNSVRKLGDPQHIADDTDLLNLSIACHCPHFVKIPEIKSIS